MRKHAVALAVLSSLGLAACGGDNANSINNVAAEPNDNSVSVEQPSTDVAVETPVTEIFPPVVVETPPVLVEETPPVAADPVAVEPAPEAKVTFTANLRKSEAVAAYIGQTDWIDIEIRRVPVGSYQELTDMLDECSDNYVYDCGFWDDYVAWDQINNENPSVEFSMLPGNYLIVARPNTENSDGWSVNQGRIVAFAELSEGSHMLPLYAMQANWTFETPINLMLVNQANPFDAADTETWDFNPLEEGAQSAAEMLGIDAELPLERLHLASRDTYNRETGIWPEINENWELSSVLNQFSWGDLMVPAFGQGSGADATVQPVDMVGSLYDYNELYDEETGEWLGHQFVSSRINAAESVFNYADGETTHILDLGEFDITESLSDGKTRVTHGAGVFFSMAEEFEDEDGVELFVWPEDEPWEHHYDVVMVDEETGETYIDSDMIYTISAYNFDLMTEDFDGLAAAFAADGGTYAATQFLDGSTISGALIEYSHEYARTTTAAESPDELPLPTDEEIKAATMFGMIEEMMEESEASAANERSEMCFDVSESTTYNSNNFNYAFLDGVWVPGIINPNYWIEYMEGYDPILGDLVATHGDSVIDMTFTDNHDYQVNITTTAENEVVTVTGEDGEIIGEESIAVPGDYNVKVYKGYEENTAVPVANEPAMYGVEGQQVVIYYYDTYSDYDDVVLHLWNDDNCGAYAWDEGTQPTDWQDGQHPDGIDDSHGAYWALPISADDTTDCVNFIVYDQSAGEWGEKRVSESDQMVDFTQGYTAFTTNAFGDEVSYEERMYVIEEVAMLKISEGHMDFTEAPMDGYMVYGEDLNGDGEIMAFEEGVFWNNTCEWDDETEMEVCADLDGDGEGTHIETLPSVGRGVRNWEFCIHPFTATASELDFPTADLGVVISSE